jgi:glycosyltransferase involved in cell wall biosynthesis
VLGYGAEKAHVIPLAATGNSRSGLLPRPVPNPYYLFVGTLEPRKNLPRLLRAFAAIKHRDPELKLVLAGDAGWGEQKLEQRIAELSIEDSVVLTGRLDETSLHCYYRHALALVLPSLYEGFGLPLLEAMQYGVPVITSDRSSMPEVAGDAGLLVDPEDVGSISSALTDMLENIPLRTRLAAAAAQQAIRFNWDTSAANTLAVLEGSGAPVPNA